MTKVKAKEWMIFWNEPLFESDDECYSVSFSYSDKNGKHEISSTHKTYQAAYGWLAERVIL